MDKSEAHTSRVISRTLAVLRALNSYNGSKVGELHRSTGISRPALYRFLQCLEHEGYIVRDDRGGYRLTHLVRTLSDGFRQEDSVAHFAFAELQALQRRVLWPTGFGVFANHAIYLRETTRRISPLVIDEASLGARIPLLLSSMGLAYLAFCPAQERDEILASLSKSCSPDDALANSPGQVEVLLERTLRDGYGSRNGGLVRETGSIAVPVFLEERVIGTVCITFFASVLTPAAAAARYLEDLKRSASAIESAATVSAYARN